MTNCIKILVVLILLSSCQNKIETEETLSKQDIQLIQKLNILDKDERVYKYYSEFKKKVSGNFYTNKRMANYWLDENDTTKNKIEFAFYNDIVKIDTVYNAGVTYSPYLLITKKDDTNFKICVDGNKSEITAFFKDAINKWLQNKEK